MLINVPRGLNKIPNLAEFGQILPSGLTLLTPFSKHLQNVGKRQENTLILFKSIILVSDCDPFV